MNTPAIIVHQVNKFNEVGSDFWNPEVSKEYFALGSQFTANSSRTGQTTSQAVFCVKSGSDPQALHHPVDYDIVATFGDVRIWLPRPPAGYVALGSVATRWPNCKPSLKDYVCVKRCYVVPGDVTARCWTETGHSFIAAIVAADPKWRGLTVGTFSVSDESNHFCLGADHVSGAPPPTLEEIRNLIAKFAPIHLSHIKEEFLPTSLQSVIDGCYVVSDGVGQARRKLSMEDLPIGDEILPVELEVENFDVYTGNINEAKAYVHVEPVDKLYTDIHFSIFYGLSGPLPAIATSPWPTIETADRGQTDADCREVILRFNNFDTSSPCFVYMAQHDSGEWVRYGNCERQGAQVKVYASLIDHSIFATVDEHTIRANQVDANGVETSIELKYQTSKETSFALDCSLRYDLVKVDYDTSSDLVPNWRRFLGNFHPDDEGINMSDVGEYSILNCPVGPWTESLVPLVSFDALDDLSSLTFTLTEDTAESWCRTSGPKECITPLHLLQANIGVIASTEEFDNRAQFESSHSTRTTKCFDRRARKATHLLPQSLFVR